MNIAFTFLGTGTSVGIPMLACDCPTCRSDDPRDRRFRSSVLLEWPDSAVVIDATPEFRLQLLRAGVKRLDALLLTHNHADHVHGLDDVRPFCFRSGQAIPLYGPPDALAWVRHHFAYIWEAKQVGGGLPRLDLRPVDAPFSVNGVEFRPLPLWHGQLPIYGYRVGDLAYLSDVSAIPETTFAQLTGLQTLVVDAVRYAPHATHFHVDAAVAAARRIGATQTYLTHLNHNLLHARLAAELPAGIAPAYDGLQLTVQA